MKLTDIKGVGPKLAKAMQGDGWTVEKVATATHTQLALYEGVSPKKALGIIADARRLVAERGLRDSTVMMPEEETGPAGPQPPASVRVQRIRESGQ